VTGKTEATHLFFAKSVPDFETLAGPSDSFRQPGCTDPLTPRLDVWEL
jgi:hypothetical protein